MAKPVGKGLPLVNSFASIPSLMRQVGFRDCSLVVCGFCAACRHTFSVPDCTKTWCHNWRYEYALLFRFFLWFEAWSCVWVFLLLCSWIYNMYLKVRWNWGGIENMNQRNVIYCLWFCARMWCTIADPMCLVVGSDIRKRSAWHIIGCGYKVLRNLRTHRFCSVYWNDILTFQVGSRWNVIKMNYGIIKCGNHGFIASIYCSWVLCSLPMYKNVIRASSESVRRGPKCNK